MLLCINFLFGYVDSDIDGVDDSIDRCPNTPFDKIVDIYGCSYDHIYYGKVNLEYTNSKQQKDKNSVHFDSYYLNYTYGKYIFDISKSYYEVDGEDYENDTYSSLGYNIVKDNISIKPYFGWNLSAKNYYLLLSIDYLKRNFVYNISTSYNQTTNLNYYNYSLTLTYYYSSINSVDVVYYNSGDDTKYINKYQGVDISYRYNISKNY